MFPSRIMEDFCRTDEYVNTWQEGLPCGQIQAINILSWIYVGFKQIHYANTKYKTLIAMIG